MTKCFLNFCGNELSTTDFRNSKEMSLCVGAGFESAEGRKRNFNRKRKKAHNSENSDPLERRAPPSSSLASLIQSNSLLRRLVGKLFAVLYTTQCQKKPILQECVLQNRRLSTATDPRDSPCLLHHDSRQRPLISIFLPPVLRLPLRRTPPWTTSMGPTLTLVTELPLSVIAFRDGFTSFSSRISKIEGGKMTNRERF
ncbi:hypothetical protein CEXT_767811 [Caerostris extrusa]|uniref:Uncharacterized protein n=1 Tax=Caerostris extrusa TaxID=172846 RepID=A0AAV4VGX4_CAEEX|nr:hypothetical protein CEXT_767811 [Caerostris extrusa]